MPADYQCKLNPKNLAKAKKELNEDPSNRLGAVQTLREWIERQPHITCNTDTEFLLQFLRTAKFSQLRAREILEGHLRLLMEQGKWYQDLDTTNTDHLLSLTLGWMLPLPGTDSQGRKIILYRQGAIDKTTLKRLKQDVTFKNNVVKSFGVILRYLLFDENIQVNGIVYLHDLTGYTSAHFTSFTMQEIKDIMKFQGRFPGRFKANFYYNGGNFFDTVMDLVKPFFGKKLKDRIKMLGSNLEQVYKEVPMELLPEEYLPDDYTGPTAGSLQTIKDDFIKQLQTPWVRDRILRDSSSQWRIEGSKDSIGAGETASFRKLAID